MLPVQGDDPTLNGEFETLGENTVRVPVVFPPT